MLIVLIGFSLIALIVNLVRTRMLGVGYAVLWLLTVTGLMIIISFPPLLALAAHWTNVLLPRGGFGLPAMALIFLGLFFISVRLSVLSARRIESAQMLALSEWLSQDEQAEETASPIELEQRSVI